MNGMPRSDREAGTEPPNGAESLSGRAESARNGAWSESYLENVRVLDLTTFLSGPYGTQILGDLGANVVKVEPPGGDASRHIPPHFVDGDSAYYLSVNRNKRSIVANLKDARDREMVQSLAAVADVVIESNRPGVAAKLGLEYEELAHRNPGLVWCSISGFGQDGPYRDRPAYDMIVQALSGGMSLTGMPGGPPVRAGIPLGDLSAGMYAVIAVLAALYERGRTGRGRQLDISMLDCQISMLSYQAGYNLLAGAEPGPQGRGHDSIPTYRAFTGSDGMDIVVTANTDGMWRALCGVLGRDDLLHDPAFEGLADREANRRSLEPLLEEAFLARPASEWLPLLHAARVPAAPINSVAQALRDPQVLARGMVVEVSGDADQERPAMRLVGNPIKTAHRDPATDVRRPPRLDRDRSAVLTDWLGAET
jgi:CoA:oxalate CoA-transferase